MANTIEAPSKMTAMSLVTPTVISGDSGTVTAYSDRKASDFALLVLLMKADNDTTVRATAVVYPNAMGSVMLFAHHGSSLENLSGMTVVKTSDTTFTVTKTGSKGLSCIEIIGVKST